MEIRYWIEIGIVLLIIVVGVLLKLCTKKILKSIDGFHGIYKRDENGVLVPVQNPDSEEGQDE